MGFFFGQWFPQRPCRTWWPTHKASRDTQNRPHGGKGGSAQSYSGLSLQRNEGFESPRVERIIEFAAPSAQTFIGFESPWVQIMIGFASYVAFWVGKAFTTCDTKRRPPRRKGGSATCLSPYPAPTPTSERGGRQHASRHTQCRPPRRKGGVAKMPLAIPSADPHVGKAGGLRPIENGGRIQPQKACAII